MYTFSQLLLRNATLALIFIISISIVSLLMLYSLLEDKATQHNQVISLLTNQVITTGDEVDAANRIAKKLQQATTYNILMITHQTGDNLFSYKNSDMGLTLPFISPKGDGKK
jgi:RNase E specificity factor CsrD